MINNKIFLILLILTFICLITGIFFYNTNVSSNTTSGPILDLICNKLVTDAKNNNDRLWGGQDLSGTKSGKAFDICNKAWTGSNGKMSNVINGTLNFFNMKTSNSTYSSVYNIKNDTYLYFPKDTTINYIFVGGGGGGGKNSTFYYNPNGTVQCGGGGGEGASIQKNNINLSSGLYKITIGTGGSIGFYGSATILSKVDLATNNLTDIIKVSGGSPGTSGRNESISISSRKYLAGNGGGIYGGLGGSIIIENGSISKELLPGKGRTSDLNIPRCTGGGGGVSATGLVYVNQIGTDGGKVQVQDQDDKNVDIYGSGGTGGSGKDGVLGGGGGGGAKGGNGVAIIYF